MSDTGKRETFPLDVTTDIRIDAYFVGRDFANRDLFGIPDDEDTRRVYEGLQLNFWRDKRTKQKMPLDNQALIISEQAEDYNEPKKQVLGAQLEKLASASEAAGKPEFSILELGCANGPTLRHLNKSHPGLNVRFHGFELTDFLADDLCRQFPDASAAASGADELMKLGPDDFGVERFDLFLASGVLCQMPPYLVSALLKHIGGFCDKVLIWDYLLNFDGRLSSEDAVFFGLVKHAPHILFLNPYNQQFADAGFEDLEMAITPVTSMSQGPGEGVLLAQRRA
jgi:hypothetical protein